MREELSALQNELSREREAVRGMETKVNSLRNDVERFEADHSAFASLNAGFRGEFDYPDDQPTLSGTFRNDLNEAVSSLQVEVAFSRSGQTLRRELLEVRLDPIALSGDERPVAADASPQTWGFRKPIDEGSYEFTVLGATLPSVRTLRNDPAQLQAENNRLTRLEREFLEKRLRIGELVTRITDLEESLR